MNGYGRFIYANGDHYEGQFANNKKNGQGKFISNRTGLIQEGKWVADKYAETPKMNQ